MKLKIYSIVLLFVSFNYTNLLAWGGDVEVTTFAPLGATSVVANSGGTLYASVPQTSLNPTNAMSIYSSTDNGATWTQLNIGGGNPGDVVVKSKMLVTGSDTVVCVFQITDNIYTLNIATGIVTPFTTVNAQDFDAAASPNNNSIYLYVDVALNDNLNRFSSLDAGATWTGSTALVSGDAAHPRVYMSGTRLFLAYFGPLQSDVALSKIVTAYYNETAPGTLTSVSGSFQDIVTSISVRKHQFQSVGINGSVWFFWTEGMSPSVLKCRLSVDGGLNYGLEFAVAGSSTMEVERFDAKHFSNTITSGVQFAYYADSVQAGAPDSFTERILFSTADISNPQTFSSPQQLSDHTVNASSAGFNITLIDYYYNLSEASGVLWVQDDGGGSPSLFYDASSSIVDGVKMISGLDFSIDVFPNPVNDKLTLILRDEEPGDYLIELSDLNGRILFSLNTGFKTGGAKKVTLDFSKFNSGLYYLSLSDGTRLENRKIVKM